MQLCHRTDQADEGVHDVDGGIAKACKGVLDQGHHLIAVARLQRREDRLFVVEVLIQRSD